MSRGTLVLLAFVAYIVFPKGSSLGIVLASCMVGVITMFSLKAIKLSGSAIGVILCLLVFIIYTIANFFYHSAFRGAEQSFSNLLDPLRYLLALCFFLLGYSLSEVDRSKFIKFFLWIVILNFFVVLLQKIGGEFFYSPFTGRDNNTIQASYLSRAIGTIGNPNILASFFSVFLIYSFARLKNKFNSFDLIIVVLCSSIIILSQSRSTLVYALSAFFAYSILYKEYRFKFIPSVFAILFVIFCSYLVTKIVDLNYLISGFVSVFEEGLQNQSSFAARVTFWNTAYEMVVNDIDILIFGLGFSDFNLSLAIVDNAYIYGVLKYGIPYFLFLSIYVYLLSLSLSTGLKNTAEARFLFIAIVMVLLSSMTGDILEAFSFLGLVFFLGGMVVRAKVKNLNNNF